MEQINDSFFTQVNEEVKTGVYEKYFSVEEGDDVIDIGASFGPFVDLVLTKKPSTILCIEPNVRFFNILKDKYSKSQNIKLINKAVGYQDVTNTCFIDVNNSYEITNDKIFSFTNEKANFLKVDCEGGEYSLFNNSLSFLLSIDKIVMEIHLRYEGCRKEFKNFRQNLLPKFNKHLIHFESCKFQKINNGVEVSLDELIYDDSFVDSYNYEFILYIEKIKKYNEFKWGILDKDFLFKRMVYKEVMIHRMYERFFEVEAGDIVMDIGASVGCFSYSILEKHPSVLYCIEPHIEMAKTIKENISEAIVINSAFQNNENNKLSLINSIYHDKVDVKYRNINILSFTKIVKVLMINSIDFLKIDCEGGEYSIFTTSNREWILNNVRKIAGEFHLHNSYQKSEFYIFRELYLRNSKFYILSYDGIDITNLVWDTNFINEWEYFNVYIDNR